MSACISACLRALFPFSLCLLQTIKWFNKKLLTDRSSEDTYYVHHCTLISLSFGIFFLRSLSPNFPLSYVNFLSILASWKLLFSYISTLVYPSWLHPSIHSLSHYTFIFYSLYLPISLALSHYYLLTSAAFSPNFIFLALRLNLKTSRWSPLTIMFRPDNFPHHLGRLHAPLPPPPPPQRPNQPSSSHHHTSRLVTRHPGGKIPSCFGHGRRFCHFVFSRVRPVNSPCFSVFFLCGMLRVIAIACLPEQHHCAFSWHWKQFLTNIRWKI